MYQEKPKKAKKFQKHIGGTSKNRYITLQNGQILQILASKPPKLHYNLITDILKDKVKKFQVSRSPPSYVKRQNIDRRAQCAPPRAE